MHSPLPSPALRAITQAHHSPHLARACAGPPASYFALASGCPATAVRYDSSPRASAYESAPTTTPMSSPSLPGGLISFGVLGATMSGRTTARQGSIRESAIPLRPIVTPTPPSANSVDGSPRKRPSFKIDLPPRPVPSELMAPIGGYTSISTPTRAVTCVKGTPYPLEMDLSDDTKGPNADNDFIILGAGRGAHRCPERGFEQEREHRLIVGFDDERYANPNSGVASIGLGYSLNRMRAPTPWVRSKAQESEWLSEFDLEVEELEGQMSCVRVA